MKKKREVREDICPGDIIQGNPDLEAVINTSPGDANIFFEHKDAVKHCTHHCKKTTKKCIEEHQKTIADIFKSHDKEVVEYIPQHISTN